jgi:hypothetical protein
LGNETPRKVIPSSRVAAILPINLGAMTGLRLTQRSRIACICAVFQAIAMLASKLDSVATWKHFNLHGEFDFSDERMVDSIALAVPKNSDWKLDKNWEADT